ncbi:MAG TPA: hypothetical protein VHV82_01965 [Sporichthyaceae bacterium]|nr:hypothetical protein [Sporichthyaceae bacterium]
MSVLWPPATFESARSAYLADLENLPEAPVGFARWVDRAVAQHAGLTRNCRAALAGQLPTESADRRPGVSRSFTISSATVAAMQAAIIMDARHTDRVVNRNRFAGEAVRAAVEVARRRNGGTLPSAPGRLPTTSQRR